MPELEKLLQIMKDLRDPKNGCPWDIEQDFASIAAYTVEEAYEVADAIERNDLKELKGELGDLADAFNHMADNLAGAYDELEERVRNTTRHLQEERNRLARDLHDSVTQVLFTANLVAEVLPQIWQRDPEQAMESLEELRRLTRGALAEMRTMLRTMVQSYGAEEVATVGSGDLVTKLVE